MPQLCFKCGSPLTCHSCPGEVPIGRPDLPCRQQKGALWIHVYDDEANNLENVPVKFDGTERPTKKDGLSVIDPLDSKDGYKVALPSLGPYASTHEPPDLAEITAGVQDGNITYVPIELRRLSWVGIRFWNGAGKVLSGLKVSIQPKGRPAEEKLIDASGLTPEGVFRLEAVPAGDCVLKVLDLDEEMWDVRVGSPPSGPPVTVAWSKPAPPPPAGHSVADGECIWTIAVRYGLSEDIIWKAGANSALAARYRSGYTLSPGDTVQIPPARLKQVTIPTGSVHDFVLRDLPREVVVRFMDRGKPAAEGIEATVTLTGKPALPKLTTETGGVIRFLVAPEDTEAVIEIPDLGIEKYTLRLGGLRPVETADGVKQRLLNLGYLTEAATTGATADQRRALEAAVRSFQGTSGVPRVAPSPGGTVDEPTMKALVAACGA